MKNTTNIKTTKQYDDITLDSEHGDWTQLCSEHAELAMERNHSLTPEGSGICGALGCSNESNHYLTLGTKLTSDYINKIIFKDVKKWSQVDDWWTSSNEVLYCDYFDAPLGVYINIIYEDERSFKVIVYPLYNTDNSDTLTADISRCWETYIDEQMWLKSGGIIMAPLEYYSEAFRLNYDGELIQSTTAKETKLECIFTEETIWHIRDHKKLLDYFAMALDNFHHDIADEDIILKNDDNLGLVHRDFETCNKYRLNTVDIIYINGDIHMQGLKSGKYYVVEEVDKTTYGSGVYKLRHCSHDLSRKFATTLTFYSYEIDILIHNNGKANIQVNRFQARVERLIRIGFCQRSFYKPSVWKAAMDVMKVLVKHNLAYPHDFGHGKGKYTTDLSLTDDISFMAQTVISKRGW
jgi:hypothetical protein